MQAAQETLGLPTHKVARLGLGYCPEERGIFSSLSCEENLMLPPVLSEGGHAHRADLRDVSQPEASARSSQGTRLSGGEQQMLAVARILRTGAQACCCSTRSPKAWRP